MTRNVAFALAAVAAAAFAAGAFAQDPPRWVGMAPSHQSRERFDMSVGVTPGQLPRRPVQFGERREVHNVPGHYGSLVGMTGDSLSTVFWFRDAEGALRNAVVHDAATRLYKIQSTPTLRYEADAREE